MQMGIQHKQKEGFTAFEIEEGFTAELLVLKE